MSGTVLSIDQGAIYTVSFVDQQGQPQTGAGPVASGTDAPEVGETVSVFYNTTDPSQIVILNIPGGGFLGIADTLRTVGIVCLIVGAVLLAAGIISLLMGRKPAAVTGPPTGYPPVQPGAQPRTPGIRSSNPRPVTRSSRRPRGIQQQPPPGHPPQQPPSAYQQQPPPAYPAAAAGISSNSRPRRRATRRSSNPQAPHHPALNPSCGLSATLRLVR